MTRSLAGDYDPTCSSSQSSPADFLTTCAWRARSSSFRRLMVRARRMLFGLLALVLELLLLSVLSVDLIVLAGPLWGSWRTSGLLPPQASISSPPGPLDWKLMRWQIRLIFGLTKLLTWASCRSSRSWLCRHIMQSFDEMAKVAGPFALYRSMQISR